MGNVVGSVSGELPAKVSDSAKKRLLIICQYLRCTGPFNQLIKQPITFIVYFQTSNNTHKYS